MQQISNKINKMFQNLFITKNKIHPFFNDIKKVLQMKKEYMYNIKKVIDENIKYENININIKSMEFNNKYDELNIVEMNKLLKEINNILNFNKILNLVSYMSQFIIKSNISDSSNAEDKIYDKIKNKDDNTINVMIIGSGPVGLFIACYLSIYYNQTQMTNFPNVNIIMYDSRIEKPGFRKPYNRQRIFSTNSKYLNMIIPKLFCWKNDNKNEDNYINVNIFILEYILFTIANKYKIPMIYKDYTWDDYKDIINKGKFDVVFDCTGGRLNSDIIKITKKDTEWLNNIKLKGMNRKLDIDIEKNLVLLQNDSKHIDNYFYGSLILHSTNNNKLIFHKNFDIDINNKHDLFYLNNVKNKYYKYEETIDIIKGIKDDTNRNLLYSLINNNYKDLIFEFDVWAVYMRHAIKISNVFKVNNRDILFIGAGDTIFHSHFLTGSGLNRIFDFTVKCINLIDRIKE